MPSKQKNGLYRTKIKIGVDADGKDIVKWISGKTKAELEKARQEVVSRYIDCTALNDDRLFGEYAVEWYKKIKEPQLSKSSIANWRSMLNKHVLPAFGDRKLRSITSTDLQIWINSFAGKSSTLIDQASTAISNIFEAACADRIIPNDPSVAVKRPKPSKSEERRSLTDDETRKIESIIAHHEYGMYMACLYYLGVRPGEARGLMWGDVDWEANVIHIQRDIDYKDHASSGGLKTDAAYRDVPMQSELRSILWKNRGLPQTYLFTGKRSGAPWSKATSERIWLDMMRSVGLVEERTDTDWKNPDIRSQVRATISPYYLRHNFITKCWEAGLDPLVTMRIVGHTDYRTTINIYTHLNNEVLSKAKVDLEDVFKKSCTKVAQPKGAVMPMQKENR